MKRFVSVIVFLVSCLTAGAEWLFTDYYPWIWSSTNQSWEYSLTSRIAIWSQSDGSVYWLGWEDDLQEIVDKFHSVLVLKDDDLYLLYGLSGPYKLVVQFGGEINSEAMYANYSISYLTCANVVQFFVSEEAESPSLAFSLALEFTEPTGGRYTLQGIIPDRKTDHINGFYASTGEFGIGGNWPIGR